MSNNQSIIISIRFIFSLTLFVTLFHYLFISDFEHLVNRFISTTKETTFLSSILLIVASLDIYITYPTFIKLLKDRSKSNLTNILWALGIMSSLFSWFYFNSKSITIWTDELNQFAWSAINPIKASAIQYQMPISYFQSYMSELLIPDRRLAIRFSTLLNYSAALTTLFFIVLNLTKEKKYSFLIILFCCTNFSLLYSSVNARPQSVSFLCFLFLLNEINIVKSVNNFSLRQSLSIFSTTTLFLLSIGLQPPFLILASYISFATFLLKKERLKAFLKITLAFLFSTVIFLAYQLNVIKGSNSKFTSNNLIDFLNNNFSQINFINLDILKLFKVNGYLYLLYLFLFILFADYIKRLNKINNDLTVKSNYLFFLLLTSILFITTLYNFYLNNIEYNFPHRYISTVLPIFFLILTLLIANTAHLIKNSRPLTKIIIITLFSPLVFSLKFSNYKDLKDSKPWSLFDGEKIYTHITKTVPYKSKIFCLSAHWGHTYKNCSGIEHLNSAYKLRDYKKPYIKLDFSSYDLFPTWRGYWGPDLTDMRSKQFTFIFMSNHSTLLKIRQFLSYDHAYIENSAYFVTIPASNAKVAHKFLTKVKSFLIENKLKNKSSFDAFLSSQKELIQ